MRTILDLCKRAKALGFSILLIEAAALFLALFSGKGDIYLRVAPMVFFICMLFYILVVFLGGNRWVVICSVLLLTLGMFMQTMLIDREYDATKSILYEIYQLANEQEITQKYENQIPIEDYFGSREEAVSAAKVLVVEANLDYENYTSAAMIKKVVEEERIIVESGLFEQYDKALENRTNIRNYEEAEDMVRKLAGGLVIALVITLIVFLTRMPWIPGLSCLVHYFDWVAVALSGLTVVIMILLFLCGGGSGANITLLGVQPFELVKICYLFIISILFCKPEYEDKKILKRFDRYLFGGAYMLGTAGLFVLISELGTMVILVATGLCFLFIFCPKRLVFYQILLVHIGAFVIGGAFAGLQYRFDVSARCDVLEEIQMIAEGTADQKTDPYLTAQYDADSAALVVKAAEMEIHKVNKDYSIADLKTKNAFTNSEIIRIFNTTKNHYQLTSKMKTALNSAMYNKGNHLFLLSKVGRKIYERVIYWKNPELDRHMTGYQYIQMKQALAVSGLFGAEGGKYKFDMAEQDCDLAFAKCIQYYGVSMGAILIVLYVLLLLSGYSVIKRNISDSFYQALGSGIIIMLAFQGILHMACNIGLFPLTGVPLLYISRGGSNMMISLSITSILLLISTGAMERIPDLEKK